jgi:hypothetical protein
VLSCERGVINARSLEKTDPSPFSMVTKQQLGIFVIAIGVIGVLGTVAVDALGAGRWGGLGPLQRLGIALGFAAVVVGLILVRLGDRPA